MGWLDSLLGSGLSSLFSGAGSSLFSGLNDGGYDFSGLFGDTGGDTGYNFKKANIFGEDAGFGGGGSPGGESNYDTSGMAAMMNNPGLFSSFQDTYTKPVSALWDAGTTGSSLFSPNSDLFQNINSAVNPSSANTSLWDSIGGALTSPAAKSFALPVGLGLAGALTSGFGSNATDQQTEMLRKKAATEAANANAANAATAANTAAQNRANAEAAEKYYAENKIDKEALKNAYVGKQATDTAALGKKAGSYTADKGTGRTTEIQEKNKRNQAADYGSFLAKLAELGSGVSYDAYKAMAGGNLTPAYAAVSAPDYETPSFGSSTATGLGNLLANLASSSATIPLYKYLFARG